MTKVIGCLDTNLVPVFRFVDSASKASNIRRFLYEHDEPALVQYHIESYCSDFMYNHKAHLYITESNVSLGCNKYVRPILGKDGEEELRFYCLSSISSKWLQKVCDNTIEV